MKNIIILISLLGGLEVAFSQTNCDNNVSTNPLNPTNNNLPLNNSEKYLNQFDWVNIDPQTSFYSQYEVENFDFNGVELE